MAWTQQQKDDLLPLVKQGWLTFCKSHVDVDPNDYDSMTNWYQAHMLQSTGHITVDTLGNNEAYDIVMDYFQRLVGVEG